MFLSILSTSVALQDTLTVVSKTNAIQFQDALSILAVGISAILAIVAWATLREHNRPYVIIYAEIRSGYNVDLVIKNSGNRAAYNVSVKTDVPLESVLFSKYPQDKPSYVTEKTHPFIGPDQSISSEFDLLSYRYPRYPREVEGYKEPCDKYNIIIKYYHKKRKFIDTYQLDLSYLEFVPQSLPRNHLGEINNTLKRISEYLPGGLFYYWNKIDRKSQYNSCKDNEEMIENTLKEPEGIEDDTK